ncbi:MAG: VCBS repeat-containing protein [Candidatus Omnitrophota bacterium]
MLRSRRNIVLFLMAIFVLPAAAADQSAGDFHWKKHTINADSHFEAAGIGDMNNDAKKDIVSGEYWYEAPAWKPHKIAELEPIDTYYNDFADEIQDVDGDGDLDIVCVTYFSKEVFWRENPGAKDAIWATHTIDTPGNMETGFLFDVNGDGLEDVFPDLAQEVVWYEKRPAKEGAPYFTKRFASKNGGGHGHGVGDVNGDGVTDIVAPGGWLEGKKNGAEMAWTWRPEFQLGTASFPILVKDVDGDGLNDIVWGLGHDYGLYWLQQGKKDGERTWTKHLIDKSWSQPHYIWIGDLKGDGSWQLVTGKRYYAHNGHDPGANDPRCIYVYTFDPKKDEWKRHVVEENGNAGFGLNPAIGDIDGDGDIDLVCPGKSGLYLFEQVK